MRFSGLRFWVIYDKKHAGGGTFPRTVRDALTRESHTVYLADTEELDKGAESTYEHPDVILLIDALGYYLEHRFDMPSRAWVCAACFSFADLYSMYQGGFRVDEVGVDTILTNCASFVEKAPAGIHTRFQYRPAYIDTDEVPGPGTKPVVGTLLPNIADRDFSLLDWIARNKPAELDFKVYTHRYSKERLPGSLSDYGFTYNSETLADITHFVSAPRITDYRGGVVPPELLQAWSAGAKPIAMFHQVLQPSKVPVFTSLSALRERLSRISRGEDHGQDPRPERELCPPMSDFIGEVLAARERWEREHVETS